MTSPLILSVYTLRFSRWTGRVLYDVMVRLKARNYRF